jgi:hypothetical protein
VGIHHEDVLLKMFMYSLAGDAHEWYHSLPPSSISSLGGFHAAFNRHCQRYYSSEFFCYNCCEGYEGHDQDLVDYDRACEDEDEEGDDALSELMELVKSLSAEIDELKVDHDRCLFEEDAEDFPALGEDVLGSPTDDGHIEGFIAEEALILLPRCLLVLSLTIIQMRRNRAPHHSLLTRREASLYMTAMNQVMRWICRISKKDSGALSSIH